MKTYEFTIVQKTSIQVVLTSEQFEMIDSGSEEGTALLENFAEAAGRGFKGAPKHLDYQIETTPLREVKP